MSIAATMVSVAEEIRCSRDSAHVFIRHTLLKEEAQTGALRERPVACGHARLPRKSRMDASPRGASCLTGHALRACP